MHLGLGFSYYVWVGIFFSFLLIFFGCDGQTRVQCTYAGILEHANLSVLFLMCVFLYLYMGGKIIYTACNFLSGAW